MKKTTTKKVVKDKQEFSIKLTLGGEVYKSKGETMFEALANLSLPVKIVTKGTVTVGYGENEYEMMLMPSKLKRMFYPLARPYIAKQFAFLSKT